MELWTVSPKGRVGSNNYWKKIAIRKGDKGLPLIPMIAELFLKHAARPRFWLVFSAKEEKFIEEMARKTVQWVGRQNTADFLDSLVRHLIQNHYAPGTWISVIMIPPKGGLKGPTAQWSLSIQCVKEAPQGF
ncbi:MAG TPA: hypothetical protein VJK09_01400 [Candidatus Paceibacterota bacterium]